MTFVLPHSSQHRFISNLGLGSGSDGDFCSPVLALYNVRGSNAPRASRKLSERLLSCSRMMSASASSVRPRASYQPWPATTAQTALSAFPTSMTSASAPVAGSTCGEQGTYLEEVGRGGRCRAGPEMLFPALFLQVSVHLG